MSLGQPGDPVWFSLRSRLDLVFLDQLAGAVPVRLFKNAYQEEIR